MQGSNGDVAGEGTHSSILAWRIPWTEEQPYIEQIAGGNLLYDAGGSNPLLCENLEEWMGWVVGGRGHMCTYD